MERPPAPSRVCDHWTMARRAISVDLDEELLAAARLEAERRGISEAEVIELALRKHLVPLEVLDRIWARMAQDPMDPDEAMELAYAELAAARADRRSQNAS